jgi:mevalonate pyrophosphate decarboxylase
MTNKNEFYATYTTHNCQTLITDIQLLLDGELDRHKENKVRLEMQQCDKCLQFYNGQVKIKTSYFNKSNTHVLWRRF